MIKVLSDFDPSRIVFDDNKLTGRNGWSATWLYDGVFERVAAREDAGAIDCPTANRLYPGLFNREEYFGVTDKKLLFSYFCEYPGVHALTELVATIHKFVQAGTPPRNIYFFLCDTNEVYLRFGQSTYERACRIAGVPAHGINFYPRSAYESYVQTHMKDHATPDYSRCELNNYLSLNAKMDKFHRIGSVWLLKNHNIYDQGKVTMTIPHDIDVDEFFKNTKPLFEQHGIPFKDIINLLINRRTYDVGYNKQDYHYEAFPTDPGLYESTFMSFVSETNAPPFHTHNEFFPSEKTFRAILNCHPFVAISTPGFLEKLRRYGYKTFAPYIDESYDNDGDVFDRMNRAVTALKSAINADIETKKRIYEIAEYNYYHALTRIKNDNDRVLEMLS